MLPYGTNHVLELDVFYADLRRVLGLNNFTLHHM